MRILVRDDFTCQFDKLGLPEIDGCTHDDHEDNLRKLQVHHIKHRINGGTHDPENLITICPAHHYVIHPHMRLELPMRQREIEYKFREI